MEGPQFHIMLSQMFGVLVLVLYLALFDLYHLKLSNHILSQARHVHRSSNRCKPEGHVSNNKPVVILPDVMVYSFLQ